MRIIAFGFLVLFAFNSVEVFAHGGEQKPVQRSTVTPNQLSTVDDETKKKEMHGKLVQKKRVGEYELKFKIVDVTESIADGGSHNLLVNIKRNGRLQKRLSVTSIVDDKHGMVKTKTMMEMGDWHLAGYDFAEDAEYAVTVSFDSMDGTTHSTTFTYP